MLRHGTCLPDGKGPQEAPVQLTDEEIKKSEEDFKVCYTTVLQHDAVVLQPAALHIGELCISNVHHV